MIACLFVFPKIYCFKRFACFESMNFSKHNTPMLTERSFTCLRSYFLKVIIE